MSEPVDVSHIRSPREPMSLAEREAVRAEMQAGSQAYWQHVAAHGDLHEELALLFDGPADRSREPDAA